MKLLPSEKKERSREATNEFEETGQLTIREPCDCGSHIRHNNGGNYHNIIYLHEDHGGIIFVKHETTCELTPPAEWQHCSDWEQIIKDHADWL